jgi:hypothetical protein
VFAKETEIKELEVEGKVRRGTNLKIHSDLVGRTRIGNEFFYEIYSFSFGLDDLLQQQQRASGEKIIGRRRQSFLNIHVPYIIIETHQSVKVNRARREFSFTMASAG